MVILKKRIIGSAILALIIAILIAAFISASLIEFAFLFALWFLIQIFNHPRANLFEILIIFLIAPPISLSVKLILGIRPDENQSIIFSTIMFAVMLAIRHLFYEIRELRNPTLKEEDSES